MENQFAKTQNGLKTGYVIMALSDRGFPALPFDVEYNLKYLEKCIADTKDEYYAEFDIMMRNTWRKVKNAVGNWTQAKTVARINNLNKVLGVTVFDTRKAAETAMRNGEVAECGGQYMRWGYEKEKILPADLCKKLENADWGVFAVRYKPGEEAEITSEQPIATYFDKDYSQYIKGIARQIADQGGIDVTDFVDKKLATGKTELDGPETVLQLYRFLDEQEHDDTWIYWNVKGKQLKVQPYFKKATRRTVEMQLQSPVTECSVYSLMCAVEDIMQDYAIDTPGDDKYFVFKDGDDAYEIGSVTKTNQRIEFNMINWGMDESKTLVDEVFDHIYECDGGGCACGGGCGGDAGAGGGISSGDVLGPGGTAENGGGCMGKDDFHVPFPVMPCLFRWPANWVGGSQKKRKKGKKTVSVKNPYVKGMKTIVAEEDGVAAYTGEAKAKFDEMTQGIDNVFTGVLTFNRKWKLAWVINDNGLIEFYKPIQKWDSKTHETIPGEKWRIYHTKLTTDGVIQLLDVSDAEYDSEETALTAIWNEAKRHKQKLAECVKKLNEQRFSPRDIMNWEAHGRDPRYFPQIRQPDVNPHTLENELKRRFPHQFEDVRLDNAGGRWTVEFKTVLPDGQREIRGQLRVSAVIPQVNRMISFLRTRGVETNQYDVSATAE